MWRAKRPAVAAIVCAIAIAGCGEADEQTTTTTTTTSAAQPTPPACAAAPTLAARQVGTKILVSWSVPDAPAGCGRRLLDVVAHSETIVGPAIPARGGMLELTTDSGTATIPLRDFDVPPYSVYGSTFSKAGRSRTVRVAVTGGPKVTPAEQRAIRARREACSPVRTTRRMCTFAAGAKRAAGPVTELTPGQLAASIRKELKATMGAGQRVTRLACTRAGTCTAHFTLDWDRYPFALEFQVRAMRSSVGSCWVVTRWRVTTPSREHGIVTPMPTQGCVY
jgi:hypothetical protein